MAASSAGGERSLVCSLRSSVSAFQASAPTGKPKNEEARGPHPGPVTVNYVMSKMKPLKQLGPLWLIFSDHYLSMEYFVEKCIDDTHEGLKITEL